MHTNTLDQQYNGYAIIPSAYRLPDGWFAANLVLLPLDALAAKAAQYKFDALDYFESEIVALKHAVAWAREWVDDRG
jgi:hypothetical protein